VLRQGADSGAGQAHGGVHHRAPAHLPPRNQARAQAHAHRGVRGRA
jgi:hypothetical protein